MNKPCRAVWRCQLLLALLLISMACAGVAQQASDSAAQFVVHFSLGPDWDQNKPPAEQTGFAEHSANMQRLRAEGFILLGARYDELGMLIVQSDSLATAERIIQADPAVTNRIFNYSIAPLSIFYPWPQPDTTED